MDDLTTFLRQCLDAEEQWAEESKTDFYVGDCAQRLLLDVAAKRQIVVLHVPANPDAKPIEGYPGWPDQPWLFCKTCGSGEPNEYPTDWPCQTLRLLASVYSDHPGYRPEWAPKET